MRGCEKRKKRRKAPGRRMRRVTVKNSKPSLEAFVEGRAGAVCRAVDREKFVGPVALQHCKMV